MAFKHSSTIRPVLSSLTVSSSDTARTTPKKASTGGTKGTATATRPHHPQLHACRTYLSHFSRRLPASKDGQVSSSCFRDHENSPCTICLHRLGNPSREVSEFKYQETPSLGGLTRSPAKLAGSLASGAAAKHRETKGKSLLSIHDARPIPVLCYPTLI